MELRNSVRIDQLNSSREAARCAASREPPNILSNLKVHYRVHKSLAVVSVLRQMNAVGKIGQVKLSRCLSKPYAMKTYGNVMNIKYIHV
jgi:hypothetical protein